MDEGLLSTKLYIPPPRAGEVARPRLVERLDEGLGQGKRLSLIAAPAGFGKTMLATAWIYSGCPHISPRSVAWLSLDQADNDPARFITYFLVALHAVEPGIGGTVRGLLSGPQIPGPEALLRLLANDLAAAGTPLVLVLDDYHLIQAPAIHAAVAGLLEHPPPPLHLILVTRQEPPLPLARLRARAQVTEIGERDLRFTVEEARAFLQETMRLSLSPAAAQSLEARTEGWITGLQLAALALHEAPDPARAEALIATFAGDDRHVTDYLLAEVLQQQPAAVRHFLRRTSILERLTAPLCNALTGRDDGQATLEALERANLFLIPLDHKREWYRYHRLLAEALRAGLDAEEQAQLQRQAGRWYAAQGLMEPAIQHALAGAAAGGDTGDAERWIELAVEDTFHRGGLATVRSWLTALPDGRVRANAQLAAYRGWIWALTGEMARAEEYGRAAEAGARRQGEGGAALGQALVLRTFIALLGRESYAEAIDLAGDALQVLAPEQASWRIIALWAMAEALERTTNIEQAIAAFRQAQQAGLALGDQIFVSTVEISLALALNSHGQRGEAMAVCRQALERHTGEAGHLSPLAGLILSRLGLLAYEANDLSQAKSYHEQGLALTGQLALGDDLFFSQGLAAPTLYALGDVEAALAAVQQGHRVATRTGYVDAGWFTATEANLRLRGGDLPFARRWAQEAGLSPDDEPDYLHIEQHLLYGRLLLAEGHLVEARRWLERLEGFTRERGLVRWLLTTHLLQSLAADRAGEAAATRQYLGQAVQLAAPEEYVRAFLDEDPQLIELLPTVRPAAPRFVDRLLAAVGAAAPVRAGQPLVEPLSARELEVLGLIAAGLSNRDIAERLVIAPGTVKRHINNLYGKLGVGSRTQAIARARELHLL